MDTATLVEKVNARLGYTDANKIARLHEIAPDHLEYAISYCNNTFTDADGIENIPGPVISFVADACEFDLNPVGLESRRMGEVTFNYETDYPKSMLRKIRQYRKLRV